MLTHLPKRRIKGTEIWLYSQRTISTSKCIQAACKGAEEDCVCLHALVMLMVLVFLQPAATKLHWASAFLTVCFWYKAWRVYPAPLLWGCMCRCLHPFLSPHWGRGIKEIAPVKAQTQLWQFITMQVGIFHVCIAWLSFQVKPLFKFCQLHVFWHV